LLPRFTGILLYTFKMGNKTLIFKKVPEGMPVPGQDLVVEDRGFDHDAPPPKGGLTLEIIYVSYDPYLRGRMRAATVQSYAPPFDIDGPVVNTGVGRVLKSDADFEAGDLVLSYVPLAEYATIPDPKAANTRKIQNPYNLDLALFLGPLGMPGLTAWAGLYKIGQPKKGETIFVSSAAGAVGQVVGHIAKHEGLTVIGSVGTDEKLEFIKSLGFDSGFNYKKEKPQDALPRLAPDGIDIYFENVGGDHFEAALASLHENGRMPICGAVSQLLPRLFSFKIQVQHIDRYSKDLVL
jgi:NADPH-dependent curcumin reductase CurA